MKSPAISVIIPVYNQEKYVGKCIRSVLGQYFQDYEVILVNDGSTDKTLTICQKYARQDTRISIIDKKNEGLAFARRDGLLQAKGVYIAFVDSDDYIEKNAFETLIGLSKHQEIDLIVGNYDRVYDSYGLIRQRNNAKVYINRPIEKDDVKSLFLGTEGIQQHSVAVYVWGRIYRKSCVLQAYRERGDMLFPQETNAGEDMFFNLTVMPYIKRLWITDEVVYHYRYGGMTSRYLPIVKNGKRYFDLRYDYCVEFQCQDCLNPFFYHYLSLFYQDVRMQMHFHIGTDDTIREFISRELKERKIVLWAKNHFYNEETNNIKIKAILDDDVEGIMDLARQDEKRLWLHYLMKSGVVLYQKLLG